MAQDPMRIAHELCDAAFKAWLEVEDDADRHAKLGRGAGGNLTSRADDHLEKAILAKAKQLGISVLSEEAGLVDRGSRLLAVVDPLDGSRNAGRGIPFFCTSVAVGLAGERGTLKALKAGVVQNLVTGDTYSAAKGKGAYVNGKKVKASRLDRDEILVGLIADYASTEIEQAHARSGHHIRDLGSAALEMCLVGTGALDAFVVRRSWLRVLDIAAATLFIREAGGLVVDPDTGKDLDTPFNMEVRTGVLAAHSPEALAAAALGPKLGVGKAAGARAASAAAAKGARKPKLTWALVAKASIPHVRKEAEWIRGHLEKRGQRVLLEKAMASALGTRGYSLAELDSRADLFVTVGGDGTILMALNHTEKPILGVNAGAIGFLAEVEPAQAAAGIDQVLAGHYRVEERGKLASWLDGKRLPDATNEVTVQTSRIAKLIRFKITVAGQHLDTLRGDGLIVSTATGSTGYAMSVGGPLVHPSVQGTVLAPIAPFRLAARPWVVPSDAAIEVHLQERESSTVSRQAKVVVDGQHGTSLSSGSVVRVVPSERKARFIRLGSGFYERVRTKLTR